MPLIHFLTEQSHLKKPYAAENGLCSSRETVSLKGLSYEIDFKNVDEN
jgi:hypothetical protein